jgi:hypothetical protein
MFQSVVQETPSTKSCVFDGLRQGFQIENKCCVSDSFRNCGLAISHVSTAMHCVCQCSCGLDLNTQAGWDLVLKKRKMPSTRTGWARCTEGRQLRFLLLDSELTMCDVSNIDELCDDSGWSGH